MAHWGWVLGLTVMPFNVTTRYPNLWIEQTFHMALMLAEMKDPVAVMHRSAIAPRAATQQVDGCPRQTSAQKT